MELNTGGQLCYVEMISVANIPVVQESLKTGLSYPCISAICVAIFIGTYIA